LITINSAQEFSDAPGSRYKKDGDFSGEEFREKFLEEHFKDQSSDEKIQIILDGAEGYATSFLEEAFGGLARIFGKEKCLKRLEFVSNENELLIAEIINYINTCDE